MSWSEAGVIFSEKNILQPDLQGNTAVPVFVGFTAQAEVALTVFWSWDDFVQQAFPGNVAASPLAVAMRLYFDNGGTLAWVLSAGAIPTSGADIAMVLQAAIRSDLLAAEAQITLLCVPDIILLNAQADSVAWADVWQAMLEVSRARQGCFALLDLPAAHTSARRVLQAVSGLQHSEFGATYWPHLNTCYRNADAWVSAVPSAAIAAVIQKTDAERGVWKAPANVALEQVVRPQYFPRKAMEVFQQAAQVNLIRAFPGRGVLVWGCRTLLASPASPWRFLQVRRLLSHIEARLTVLGRFCVFEPNNEITWFKLKSLCRSWLRNLWLDGALYGLSEDEAFRLYVGLDESMSQEDILAGRLILKAEVAALYPAQYIGLSVRFHLSQAQSDRGILWQ